MQTDEMLQSIAHGIGLNQAGDREAARRHFTELWEAIGPDGDPLHRCSLAHSMADAQDDPAVELEWDLRALEAAEAVTDEQLAAAGMPSNRRGLYPSLHLNLADVSFRLGRFDDARAHLTAALEHADALNHDEYGRMVKGALSRLAAQLAPAE